MLQLVNASTTMNYNLVVLQRSTTNFKLSNWAYFWNKCCNLSFLAICHSQFPLLIFRASSWFQKAKIALRMSLRNKKMWLNVILKGFIKQSVIAQSTHFYFQLIFLIGCCMIFFSLSLSNCWLTLKNWKYFVSNISSCIKMEKIWKFWQKYFAKNL